MSISEVRMTNLRGSTRQITLAGKTLLVGPNGCGKTTVSAAIQLALLGYIPGYDKKGVFANSSDGKTMHAGVTVDEKEIDRMWKQGKALSETLIVNGVSANKNAADAMIQMALGNEPRVFDVRSFFASTATEKRRTCLGLVATKEEIDSLTSKEAAAREDRNRVAAERREKSAVVDRLLESRSEMGAPAGNIAALRDELAGIVQQYNELAVSNATAIENDRLRAELKVASDEEVASERVRLDEIQKLVAPAASKLSEVMGAIEELGLRPKPTGPREDEVLANDEVEKAETAIAESLDRIGGIPDGERFGTFTPAGRARLNTIRVSLQGLHDCLYEDEDGRAIVTEILSLLNEIYPDERTMAAYDEEVALLEEQTAKLRTVFADKKEALSVIMQSRIDAQTKAEIAWDQASRRLEKDRVVAQADVNNVSAAIREQNKTIAAMIAAADKLKNLGAGVDPKDAEVLEGLQSRRLELDAKIRELAKFETIDAEVEKARIALSEVDAKEEKAKAALEAVIAKQQSVVASFTHILADRSTAILPTGRLDMEDDGKNIEIVWVRDDKRTRRDTLSGGEQATFDAAMGYALAPKALVIIEAAEVDTWAGRDSLSVLLAHLEKAPCDLLVMTCHDAKTVPEGWSTVTLGVD